MTETDIDRDPGDRRLCAAEGYLELGMPEHALRELRSRARLQGHDGISLRLAGEAKLALGDSDAAGDDFRRALELGTDDPRVHVGLARCLRREGRLDEAIDAMQRAYELDEANPVVLYGLACYHALSGRKEQALSWLGRAIRREQSLRRVAGHESDFDALRNDPDFQFVVEGPDG